MKKILIIRIILSITVGWANSPPFDGEDAAITAIPTNNNPIHAVGCSVELDHPEPQPRTDDESRTLQENKPPEPTDLHSARALESLTTRFPSAILILPMAGVPL